MGLLNFFWHLLDFLDVKALTLSLKHLIDVCGSTMLSLHFVWALLRSSIFDQSWVFRTFLLDIWILKDGVTILQSLIALWRWSSINTDGYVKLQDGEKSHSEPQWNRDGIVLIWDVVDSKAIEHFIRHKGPNHVNDEHNCRQIPRKEPIELNDRYVRLLFLAGHHVDLFEFSLFVFLLQELSLLEWASLATGLILYGQLEIVHVVLMVV